MRAMHPSLIGMYVRDAVGARGKLDTSRAHLDATMAWLCKAQDSVEGGGVSAGYSVIDGWLPPYPETTGYIIPTFYDYARLTGREEFRLRARRMADWELEVQ